MELSCTPIYRQFNLSLTYRYDVVLLWQRKTVKSGGWRLAPPIYLPVYLSTVYRCGGRPPRARLAQPALCCAMSGSTLSGAAVAAVMARMLDFITRH